MRLLTEGAIGLAPVDQPMTKGHLAMTLRPNGRERERKLLRILKRVRVHPPSSLRGLGISYPVSKYFVAATITRLRIARIAYCHGGTRDFQNKFRNTAERRCDAKTKFKIKTGAGHHPVRLISITTANSRLLGDRETTAPKVTVSTLPL